MNFHARWKVSQSQERNPLILDSLLQSLLLMRVDDCVLNQASHWLRSEHCQPELLSAVARRHQGHALVRYLCVLHRMDAVVCSRVVHLKLEADRINLLQTWLRCAQHLPGLSCPIVVEETFVSARFQKPFVAVPSKQSLHLEIVLVKQVAFDPRKRALV